MTADRPARVLHVTTRLNVGGIATQVLGLCEGLDPRRFEVGLVTGRVGPHEAEALRFVDRPPCAVHVVEELGRAVSARDARALVKLVRLVRDFRPDIVHTHAAKAGALGRVAAVLSGVPLRVHSYHGHVFHGYFSAPLSRAIVAFERALGRITSAVLVPGVSQRREIGQRFRIAPLSRIHVAPYGVDVKLFARLPPRDEARRRFGLRAPLVIGALGRMAPIKNQGLLLDAASLLRRANGAPEFELLFIGDGECRPALERRARELGLDDIARFHPWQPRLELVYAATDLVAITSLNEGMPIAAMEAMAAAVAVVSTAVGGVVDLIRDGETGWLVPSLDAGALAAAIRRALGDPAERRRVTERARTHITEQHSFARACAELSTIYDALLVRAGGRPLPAGGVAASNAPREERTAFPG